MQRALFVILTMNFLVASASAADPEKTCANRVKTLSGAKITKENALSGAVVVVDKVGPASYNGMPTDFNGQLPVYDQHEFLNTIGHLVKGDQLEILEGPAKRQNVVSVLVKLRPTGIVGRVFWSEFKFSTRLVSEGNASASTKKKKSTIKLKFPGRQDASALDRGLTFYGREFAKQGDLVWVGNMARSMSPKYLGRIPLNAKIPVDLNGGYVDIELVTGEETSMQPIWVIPLLPDEIRQAKKLFADQIVVDWFK